MSPAEFNLTWPLDESLVVSGHLIKTTTAPPTSKSFHIPPPSAIPGTCLPRLAAKHHHKATPPPPQGERHQYGAVAVNTTTTNVALASIHPTPSLGLFLFPARCSFGPPAAGSPQRPLKLKFIKLVCNQTRAPCRSWKGLEVLGGVSGRRGSGGGGCLLSWRLLVGFSRRLWDGFILLSLLL